MNRNTYPSGDTGTSMEKEYGDDGFIPTVNDHHEEYGDLVLETIDERPETDLVQVDGTLVRASEVDLSDEQKEQLALYERN